MPHAVTEEAALRAVSLTGFVSCGAQSRVTLSKNVHITKRNNASPMPRKRHAKGKTTLFKSHTIHEHATHNHDNTTACNGGQRLKVLLLATPSEGSLAILIWGPRHVTRRICDASPEVPAPECLR